MTDWSDIQKQAVDPARIKAELPVAYVLEQHGHRLEQKGDILACPCPFHQDSDPSLDVYDGGDRWGCFPCGIGGDVLDLIGRLENLQKHGQRMTRAIELRDEMREAGWTAPAVQRQAKAWDAETVRTYVDRASVAPSGPLYDFLAEKATGSSPRLGAVDPEDLRAVWGVGTSGDEIVIPYWNRQGEIVAYKHRTARTHPKAAPGSTLKGVLYGEWLDTDPSLPVLLCEGETDTWAAWAAVDGYAVLGLPAGAGPHAKQAPALAGRNVVLGFDGDDAGRTASKAWSKALIAEGCTVELLPVPDGLDLSSVSDIQKLLDNTRPLKAFPEGLEVRGDQFVRVTGDSETPFTNWRFEPEVEMVGDRGTTYEGRIYPGGKRAALGTRDLNTKSSIVNWSSAHGVSWMGSDRDAQVVLAWLQAKGPYLAAGTLVQTAGLHDGSFIWPGGKIGPERIVYSPPPFDVNLHQRIEIAPGDWTPAQVTELRDLHEHRVTDPILAWMAAAPVRDLLASFPTLAVTGSSGSGKTTLLDTITGAFTGTRITSNLTSTTRHAVGAFLASTNAFPVWFDEYRPGGRKDTMVFLEQAIRDAYTKQQSSKGGLGDSWAEVSSMDTHAPLIVSGEDTFTETSHTERMINLPLPVQGKHPEVLSRVRSWGATGLPHAYLAWISRRLLAGSLDLTTFPEGPDHLPIRQRDNLGTLRLGWALLTEFCDTGGLVLPAPDFSLVTAAGAEASTHNPIKDALLWLLDEPDASTILRHDPETDRIYIRVRNFHQYIARSGSFVLPGRTEAIHRYLVDNYDGREERHTFFGREAACLSISRSAVG